jgi:hypothetical protein
MVVPFTTGRIIEASTERISPRRAFRACLTRLEYRLPAMPALRAFYLLIAQWAKGVSLMNATRNALVCDAAQLLGVTEREVTAYDGRLTVYVPEGVSPLSLRVSPIGRQFVHRDVTWYDRFPWASEPLPAGIYDVRLPIANSNRKTFDEQKELLLPGEEPIPLVLAQLALLYCRSKGLPDPLQGGLVRCRETAPIGYCAELRWFDDRLYVDSTRDNHHGDDLWLGAGTSAT